MKNDYQPSASIENLRRRAGIVMRIRTFFESRGFFHVETPVISQDIVVDRYLEPVRATGVSGTGDSDRGMFLQTSPEFAMKRLLASGADAIYQIGPVFRSGESGRIHNPEFTMLEWYKKDQTTEQAIEMIGELVEASIQRPRTCGLSYASVFDQFAGIDPHSATLSELKKKSAELGIAFEDDGTADRDQWLNLILTHVIEPRLGTPDPVVIFDWPATQSALARVKGDNPPVADRFELYIDGVELANGYNELLDSDELARRNAENNRLRKLDGRDELPGDSRLLEAMRAGLPQCCGVALGVDRLVMVGLGLSSIDEVMAFPVDRA